MAEVKWIKLSVNMFNDEKIKLIRTMPEGDSIALIWIQILCLAGKINDGGWVYMGQNLAYSDEMLATILGHPLNTMRVALNTLEQFEMIDISSDGRIDVSNWEKHQNIEGMERIKSGNAERQRVRYYRKIIKEMGLDPHSEGVPESSEELKEYVSQLRSNKPHVRLTGSHGPDTDIDIERDIDIYSSSKTDEDLKKISDFYQKNIGVLAPNTIDDLLTNYQTFGFEMVMHALTITVDNQKTYGYTKGIFQRWLRNNTKSMDDVRAAKVAYERKQQVKGGSHRKGNTYKEPLPESMQNKVEHQEEVSVESEAELRKRLAEVFKEE